MLASNTTYTSKDLSQAQNLRNNAYFTFLTDHVKICHKLRLPVTILWHLIDCKRHMNTGTKK